MFLLLLAWFSLSCCDWCGYSVSHGLYEECVNGDLFACDLWNVCDCRNTVDVSDGRRLLFSNTTRC